MFSTEEGTKLTFTEVQTSSWQGKMRPVGQSEEMGDGAGSHPEIRLL